MTTVTGKYQITLPKRLVDAYGIKVGDEVELVAAGEGISIVPARAIKAVLTAEQRLRLFDQATQRQNTRQRQSKAAVAAPKGRGWTREELYTRGRSR
jgi:AbrB family looped-hinge helix DNA binding protein